MIQAIVVQTWRTLVGEQINALASLMILMHLTAYNFAGRTWVNADLPCKLLAPAEKPNKHTLDAQDFAICEPSKTALHSMVHTDAQRMQQDETMSLQQARALFHFQRMVLSALARSMAFLEALQGKEVHTLLGGNR